MNVVLVGGFGDGLRKVIPDGQTRLELMRTPPINLKADMVPEPIYAEKQVYNFFRLHPVTRAVIFAYEELTPTQIMEKLLDGYHPKESV